MLYQQHIGRKRFSASPGKDSRSKRYRFLHQNTMRGTSAPHSQFQTVLWLTQDLYLAAQMYMRYTAPDVLVQGCPSKAGSSWAGLGGDSLTRTKASTHCCPLRN